MRGRSPVIQRRGAAPHSPPLGRCPAMTPTTMAISSAAVLPSLKHKLLPDLESDIPASTEASSSRNTIGLGHPSTSKRCAPLESGDVADPPQHKRPRTNSSTIKRSTECFPTRTLHSIAEHPATIPQQTTMTPRSVSGTRKRSYAQAARAAIISAHIP
ncbi:hypothetical protein DFH08DRAFT_847795, partial [Mycena albidolilacea]